MQWREKRVLVTGGAGFFRLLCRGEVARAGCQHVAVPRSKEYDLRNRDAIIRLYTEVQPHIVMHLAGRWLAVLGANRVNPGRFSMIMPLWGFK